MSAKISEGYNSTEISKACRTARATATTRRAHSWPRGELERLVILERVACFLHGVLDEEVGRREDLLPRV